MLFVILNQHLIAFSSFISVEENCTNGITKRITQTYKHTYIVPFHLKKKKIFWWNDDNDNNGDDDDDDDKLMILPCAVADY